MQASQPVLKVIVIIFHIMYNTIPFKVLQCAYEKGEAENRCGKSSFVAGLVHA